ncbi:hypothetical protein [Candidatus Liberibacter solanacearum]|uniref:hypothetical protein n=1 Tax=Candidatus Liberibacter solanacearum TaxID=556287 RepID=UPI001FCB45F8|nr:hypothetical protein [Candidatus Liberibacter solanacearum]
MSSDIVVFGPAEAPLFMVRGFYRFRLLIHGKRHLQKFFAYVYTLPKNQIRCVYNLIWIRKVFYKDIVMVSMIGCKK